ncbi:MAG TPA: DUF2958 domain-containing protein [Allosphingosinicella sp.]|nr:DUF2958 domain-containing protein [Allosphingosinicella sp.]
MKISLITDDQQAQMLANGVRSGEDETHDPMPVVKLFTPDAGATWLLAEIDPEDHDVAYGLCDLGLGNPELGTVRFSEIAALRGNLGLKVERDQCFVPTKPISEYAHLASAEGAIRA